MALIERPILNHTQRGEWVYDGFLGSGTTIAAAEITGRRCCGLELDPKYIDVIVQRWQQLTGKAAMLEGTACSFAQIATERREQVTMARPRFDPTEEQRRLVKTLSACGIRQKQIARRIGVRSAKTLRKHFAEELDRGALEANTHVAQTLYKMATSGKHAIATLFWLKVRAGWCERPSSEPARSAPPAFIVAKEEIAA